LFSSSPISPSSSSTPISIHGLRFFSTARRHSTRSKLVDIGARARQLQTKRLWTYALSFSCVAGFIVIVLNNFQDQMVFYVTPTDAMEQYKANPKKTKFRLGGLVLEGSVAPEKDKVPPPLLKPAKSGGWKQKKKKRSKGKHLRQASIRSSQVQAHHSIDPLLFTTRRTSFSGRVRIILLRTYFTGTKVEGILRQSADVEEDDRRVQEYELVLRELPSSPVPASCCTALLEAYSGQSSAPASNNASDDADHGTVLYCIVLYSEYAEV
ncbi:Cytochrome c-type biogenesis protein CcmE homolog, mitochondrial, partial [Linum perenne]